MRYADFNNIEVNSDWSFENVRSIEQWTHGYHRYPAKFLPNVVKKLIEQYAVEGGMIADVFAGCGTTLVESKIHGISSVGTDINPVAQLIAKVKTSPIEPTVLLESFELLVSTFADFNPESLQNIVKHERIDYWFRQEEKEKIAYLYEQILEIENENIKDFFLVCLSHILKNCSHWLMSGTKPQKDLNKEIAEPFSTFQSHCKKMMSKNTLFYNELYAKNFLNIECKIELADARKTNISENSISTIITSPPYVTSYEYADIHQLTGYWFEYFNDLREFRKKFIGTSYSQNRNTSTTSLMGQQIVYDLQEKDTRMACDVANYFNDMTSVGKEMYRILKPDGYACIVIGDTTVKDVKIKSAEVFLEILESVGFQQETIIKRNIPHKIMPTIRDKKNGRFAKSSNPNSKRVYPEEYILVVKK
jgi:DNA modification methylase